MWTDRAQFGVTSWLTWRASNWAASRHVTLFMFGTERNPKVVGSSLDGNYHPSLVLARPPVVYLPCILIFFITQPGKRSVKINVNRPRSVWCHVLIDMASFKLSRVTSRDFVYVWNTCSRTCLFLGRAHWSICLKRHIHVLLIDSREIVTPNRARLLSTGVSRTEL